MGLVYNLATTDGTYFANGFLVSNCDAIRYGILAEVARDRPGMLGDEEEEEAGEADILGRDDEDDYDPEEPFAMQRLRQRARERERAGARR